jgi:dienelactone hydrolase
MHKFLLSCVALACAPVATEAQAYGAFYPEPPAGMIQKLSNVQFAADDTLRMLMDVYRPAKGSGAPALILYTLYAAPEKPGREANEWLRSWARMAAARGIVAILPDLRAEPGTGNASGPGRARGADFQRLVAHLSAHAREYGADPERIAVFAGSGAVAAALPAVQDPQQLAIKSAVMYYGGPGANVTTFRLDLPLLYVRAGLDSQGINAEILRLATLAATQNAPLTLVNHHIGQHGFEGRNNDVPSRQIMDQTIQFVKLTTDPAYRAALQPRQLDALAAGQMSARNFGAAAQTFAQIMQQRPGDNGVRVSYGTALLADKQYDAACRELRAISPPEYGALLPGTGACVRANDPDAAIALLKSVPQDWVRFAASRLQSDSVYAPLWPGSDFRALVKERTTPPLSHWRVVPLKRCLERPL